MNIELKSKNISENSSKLYPLVKDNANLANIDLTFGLKS